MRMPTECGWNFLAAEIGMLQKTKLPFNAVPVWRARLCVWPHVTFAISLDHGTQLGWNSSSGLIIVDSEPVYILLPFLRSSSGQSPFRFLPNAKVKQSLASVCPSVCFHSVIWTDWQLFELEYCFVSVGHDHSSPGIESQGHRSRLKVIVQHVWTC